MHWYTQWVLHVGGQHGSDMWLIVATAQGMQGGHSRSTSCPSLQPPAA
jgi:hypothetical protein